MDEKWSLQDLIPVIPVIASGFAFAFVVGYFYAFNIAWFAFFSLPEHLVFALRALPIAIGASVGFLIALKSPWSRKVRWLTYAWMLALAACALLALSSNHVGIAASLVLVAAGAWFYESLPPPRSPNQRLLFWAPTLLVLCLGAGYLSGISRKHPLSVFRQNDCLNPTVSNHPPGSLAGHVIFAGNAWVLFYDYKSRSTLLLKRDNIAEVAEPCPSTPTPAPAG